MSSKNAAAKFNKTIAIAGLILALLTSLSVVYFYRSQKTEVSVPAYSSGSEMDLFLAQTRILDGTHIACPDGNKIKFNHIPTNDEMFEACTGRKPGLSD